MKIAKRDGREVEFVKEKIEKAIYKSFQSVDGGISQEAIDIASKISTSIELEVMNNPKFLFTVEDIQNTVERKLMSSSRKDVARAYITYRNDRTRNRARNSKFRDKIREKLFAKNVQNQNANVDEKSFGGRKGEADSILLKEIALDELLSDIARENHLNNEIYIHDFDTYILGMHNCLTLPFRRILKNGFNTRQADVRPARSVGTAFQLIAVLFQLQSLQQFGGVGATGLDRIMEPYVKMSLLKSLLSITAYDNDCTVDEVKDELYPMILFRAGIIHPEDMKKDMLSVMYDEDIDFVGILEDIYNQ